MEKLLVIAASCVLVYDLFIRPFRFADIGAFILLSIVLVMRGVWYSHFPVLGLFETLTFYAASMLAIGFAEKDSGLYSRLCNGFVLVLLGFSLFGQAAASPFLPDSLNTWLFPVHVAFSFISYAFFTRAFFRAVTGADHQSMSTLNYFGFVMFTIGLWAGGIWAFKAWGAYFLYSIKEIFSFTIWLYYAALIHVKYFNKREQPLRWGTIIGFILVMFTYIGIGLFMKNTHSL